MLNIRKKDALPAIHGAFDWLIRDGLTNHRIEWLGDYPLLRVSSPRDVFLTFEYLAYDQNLKLETVEHASERTFNDVYDEIRGTLEKEQFIAFSYMGEFKNTLDTQSKEIRELFKSAYGADQTVHVLVSNSSAQAGMSIVESITNLIAARFFMLKGYLVRGDVGYGPDVVAFDAEFVRELRELGMVGECASLETLATLRKLGISQRRQDSKESDKREQIIAVESQAHNIDEGIRQLHPGGYGSKVIPSVDFFDRKVLAAPFFHEKLDDIAVLTYDKEGITYYEEQQRKEITNQFDLDRKAEFLDSLKSQAKALLVANLTVQEILELTGSKSTSIFELLRSRSNMPWSSVLEKVYSVSVMNEGNTKSDDGVVYERVEPMAPYLCPTCGGGVRNHDPIVNCGYCSEKHKGYRDLYFHALLRHQQELELGQYLRYLESQLR